MNNFASNQCCLLPLWAFRLVSRGNPNLATSQAPSFNGGGRPGQGPASDRELKFFVICFSHSVNHLLLSMSSSFPTNVHLYLQFGEFLLVPDSVFHHVGVERRPLGGLRLVPRGSQTD